MKIGIIGAGLVGSTTAYTLIQRGIGREIVLVNRTRARAEAEAADLRHAVPFASALRVRAGDYADLDGCVVVIITAGVPATVMKSRMDFLDGNAAIMREIVPQILRHAPDAILLVASNPVDVMTHLIAHLAEQHGARSSRVMGSGTTLDSARFRDLIGARIGVDPGHIQGYVIGEHGDSEVATWSLVTVGAVPLDVFCMTSNMAIDLAERARISDQVRRAGYEIAAGKGATYYGVSSALAAIAQCVIHDERAVLTVSARLAEVEGVRDVTLSMPQLVTGAGLVQQLPIALDDGERAQLRASAEFVRAAIDRLGLA